MSTKEIKQTKQKQTRKNSKEVSSGSRSKKQTEKTQNETQMGMSRFFTTVAVPENLISHGQEDPIELSWKQKWFGSLLLVFLFLLIFLLGVIWFFPLNRLLTNYLNRDYGMLSNSVEKVDVSFFGKISLTNYRLKILQAPPKEISIKQLEGKISPMSLLFGKDSTGKFTLYDLGFNIPVASSFVRLHGGQWQIDYNAKINRKQPDLSQGKIKILPQNVFVSYDDVVPMLNEKIKLLIKEGTLNITVENQTAKISPSEIFTDLFHISLNGQVSFSAGGALSLNIVLTPQDLFFNKYSQSGIDQILRSMNILKEDNTIRVSVSGSLNNPQVQTE